MCINTVYPSLSLTLGLFLRATMQLVVHLAPLLTSVVDPEMNQLSLVMAQMKRIIACMLSNQGD